MIRVIFGFVLFSSTFLANAVTNERLQSTDRSAISHFVDPTQEKMPWEVLPPTPKLAKATQSGLKDINGIKLWYAIYGQGEPIMLIHESYGSANYWGNLIPVLAKEYQVIVMDLRHHGRSSFNKTPLSYDLMSDDILKLMNALHLHSVSIIGWGDGANIGINLAINQPNRIKRLYAFSGNIKPADNVDDIFKSDVFMTYVNRCQKEYLTYQKSNTLDDFQQLNRELRTMWSKEPHFSIEDIKNIKAQALIATGDHDGAISFNSDTITLATNIKNAGLFIQPFVSHFAPLQGPNMFNDSVLTFLQMPTLTLKR